MSSHCLSPAHPASILSSPSASSLLAWVLTGLPVSCPCLSRPVSVHSPGEPVNHKPHHFTPCLHTPSQDRLPLPPRHASFPRLDPGLHLQYLWMLTPLPPMRARLATLLIGPEGTSCSLQLRTLHMYLPHPQPDSLHSSLKTHLSRHLWVSIFKPQFIPL